MTGEEQFITAIIEQAIVDCAYTGTSAKKITANPHFDMGQGILECVQKVIETREFESLGD